MSEDVSTPETSARRRPIHNLHDFVGGLVLVAIGLFAIWASYDLPGMRGFSFGPGTAPRLFAGLLIAFGIAVMAMGFLVDAPDVHTPPDFPPWRQVVVALFANPVVFASLYLLFMVALYVFDWIGAPAVGAQSGGARSTAQDLKQLALILELVAWIALITFAWLRGTAIGHMWLPLLPALAAFCDLFSVLKWIPYVPTALNLACLACGIALRPRAGQEQRFSWAALRDLPGVVRGPLWVSASIFAFAAMIRPIGLIPATFLTFMISGLGSKETRWIECTIAAVAITAFCVLLFIYLLNLPFQLWPRF